MNFKYNGKKYMKLFGGKKKKGERERVKNDPR